MGHISGISLAGAALIVSSAIIYAARHMGAATILATKTGDQAAQYRFALQAGGELLPLSLVALAAGVALIVWAEMRSARAR